MHALKPSPLAHHFPCLLLSASHTQTHRQTFKIPNHNNSSHKHSHILSHLPHTVTFTPSLLHTSTLPLPPAAPHTRPHHFPGTGVTVMDVYILQSRSFKRHSSPQEGEGEGLRVIFFPYDKKVQWGNGWIGREGTTGSHILDH